jgi:hypothetical protein
MHHALIRTLEMTYEWVHAGFEHGGPLVGLFRLALVLVVLILSFGSLATAAAAIINGLTTEPS